MIFTGYRKQMDVADATLAQLDKIGTGLRASLEAYENGREHGYVLTASFFKKKSVTFSENRNSDDLVVYLINWNTADEQAQELAYQARKFFAPEDIKQAAAFILDYLKS